MDHRAHDDRPADGLPRGGRTGGAELELIATFKHLVATAGALLLAASGACAAEYRWDLPAGFPAPSVPADNPITEAKVALGCRLFFDTRLSVTGAYSCASCHRPELAFTDGRSQAIGATGAVVRRNAMTLANVAYNPAFTWASDVVRTLEDQMATPLFGTHPVEMGLKSSRAPLPQGIGGDPAYAEAFRSAFPDERSPGSMRNAIRAIASFERTLISGRSAFDAYVFHDERTALDPAARRGMDLFFSKRGGCSHCHFGLNFSGTIVHERTSAADRKKLRATFANNGLYNIDGQGSYPNVDTGLFEVTRKRGDMGKFRVPTLRNVALTAPYMHDGSLATLAEVIEHYAQGGRQHPHGAGASNPYKDPNIRPLGLTAEEKADLVKFLESLTDRAFATAPGC